MGRYLALGITSTIMLERKKNYWGGISDYNFKKNVEEVKKELNKLLNVSSYDIVALEDEMYLEIKPEHFNNNIHDLIKELNPLIYCNNCLEVFTEDLPADSNYLWGSRKEVALDENFNKENYPLIIKKSEETNKKHHKGYIYSEWDDSEEWVEYCEAPEHWLFDNKKLIEDIHVTLAYIPLWIDAEKISSEDETKLLAIMNNMSRKYYSSILSRNMFFFIFG